MNAFSLNMLPIEDSILIKVKKIESTQVPEAVYLWLVPVPYLQFPC